MVHHTCLGWNVELLRMSDKISVTCGMSFDTHLAVLRRDETRQTTPKRQTVVDCVFARRVRVEVRANVLDLRQSYGGYT